MSQIETILSKYKVSRREKELNEVVESIENRLGFTFPEDYKEYLLNYQGFEGSIGEEYVILWDLNDLLEQNEEYFILENLPATVGIGSNGAGELIALERKDENEFRVVLTPFIDLSQEYHIHIGDSFTDFLQRLKNGQAWFNETEN